MEWASALLAPKIVRVLALKGEVLEFFLANELTKLVPGQGTFTCCERRHDFGRGLVPCDKLRVRAVMEAMLDAKIAHLHRTGQPFAMLQYAALRPVLLRGLSIQEIAASAGCAIDSVVCGGDGGGGGGGDGGGDGGGGGDGDGDGTADDGGGGTGKGRGKAKGNKPRGGGAKGRGKAKGRKK